MERRKLVEFSKDSLTAICTLRIGPFVGQWLAKERLKRLEAMQKEKRETIYPGHRIAPQVHNYNAEMNYMDRHPEIWPTPLMRAKARKRKNAPADNGSAGG